MATVTFYEIGDTDETTLIGGTVFIIDGAGIVITSPETTVDEVTTAMNSAYGNMIRYSWDQIRKVDYTA